MSLIVVSLNLHRFSGHDALGAPRKSIDQNKLKFVVDADIQTDFDSVCHKWLMEFLQDRISDKTILRLVGKWLKAWALENGVVVRNDEGTPQGGPASPLLANIYLHYVLDLWFENKFKPTCKGDQVRGRLCAKSAEGVWKCHNSK